MKTFRWCFQVFVPAAASLTHSIEDLQPGFSSWVTGTEERILRISSFFSFRLFWVPTKIDFLLFVSWTLLTLSSPHLTLQGCLSTCMALSFPLRLWAWLFVKSLWTPQWLERGLSFPCNYPSHFVVGSALSSMCLVLWVFVFSTVVRVSRHLLKPALSVCASLTGETRRFKTWPGVAWSSFFSTWPWIPIGYKPFHGISLGIFCRSWLPAHGSCSMNIHWVKLVDKTCFLLIDYESKDWLSSLVV